MRRDVRGQLGNNEGHRVLGASAVRGAPGVELVERELPGEAGAERRGAEPLCEHTYGDGLSVGGVVSCAHSGLEVRLGTREALRTLSQRSRTGGGRYS